MACAVPTVGRASVASTPTATAPATTLGGRGPVTDVAGHSRSTSATVDTAALGHVISPFVASTVVSGGGAASIRVAHGPARGREGLGRVATGAGSASAAPPVVSRPTVVGPATATFRGSTTILAATGRPTTSKAVAASGTVRALAGPTPPSVAGAVTTAAASGTGPSTCTGSPVSPTGGHGGGTTVTCIRVSSPTGRGTEREGAPTRRGATTRPAVTATFPGVATKTGDEGTSPATVVTGADVVGHGRPTSPGRRPEGKTDVARAPVSKSEVAGRT